MNILKLKELLGGDDGIRFSRELRARSSTVANVHRKFALFRFPFESADSVTDLLQYLLLGGDDGIRTHDPLLAGQVLSQLSYTPILNAKCKVQNAKLLGFAVLSPW